MYELLWLVTHVVPTESIGCTARVLLTNNVEQTPDDLHPDLLNDKDKIAKNTIGWSVAWCLRTFRSNNDILFACIHASWVSKKISYTLFPSPRVKVRAALLQCMHCLRRSVSFTADGVPEATEGLRTAGESMRASDDVNRS